MADHELDSLESRLDFIENIVFGNSEKDAFYPRCLDKLANIHEKISTSTKNKKRISEIYRKSKDLQKYLDPAYTDEMTMSEEAKEEVILAEEEFLRDQAKHLENMEELKPALDSEHLKDIISRVAMIYLDCNVQHKITTPLFTEKFEALSQIQIKQQDQTSNLTEEARKMLATYNNIITLVSRQFVQWDEILTGMEAKRLKSQD
ncbi:dynactin subunit 3-like isoform X2 [Ostrea edulis]|uniref:dynactin subunit 3-like isoform X2 n=1 Tax=Ostrea edulis TaxID=37623 RepID=UPI0024AFDE93|nr:dynactin subunit 3-like isoform X2 [Ostrea edulis]